MQVVGRSSPKVSDLWFLGAEDVDGHARRTRIPDWACFMAHLGRGLAGLPAGRPTTAVVSVPIRDFAAAFAVAAAVQRCDELSPMAPDDLAAHIEVLRNTPPKTPIRYFGPKDKVYDGRWCGFEASPIDGQELICFQLRRNETRKLQASHALKVRLAGEDETGETLQARTVRTSPLLRALIGDSAALTFATTKRCDVVLVSTLAAVEAEFCDEPLLPSGGPEEARSGVLQDVARVQQFRDAHRFNRAVAVPSSAEPTTAHRELVPKLAVLDGGRAFLRYRHLWPAAHKLVVLDRSTVSAEDACAELAQDMAYAQPDTELAWRLVIPDGIEFVAFAEAA